ncbi:MAG: hypothetical protein Q9M14_00145 [Mariprofundaceae bacterium]|nr:hypothetical protein [Mariprofundaceae bacterium]
MLKPSTKSFGIRIPLELSNWIDSLAKKKRMNRNQCVTKLIYYAKKKYTATKPKQSRTVNVAWAGYFLGSVVVGLSFEGAAMLSSVNNIRT